MILVGCKISNVHRKWICLSSGIDNGSYNISSLFLRSILEVGSALTLFREQTFHELFQEDKARFCKHEEVFIRLVNEITLAFSCTVRE